MKTLSFHIFLTVTLLTLHPSSLLFAMDPKMAEEVTEGIKKFVGGEQKEVLRDRVETKATENNKTLESTVTGRESGTHQPSSSGFSSSSSSTESCETSFATLSVPSIDDGLQLAKNHLANTAEILRKVILRNPLTTFCLAASYLLPETLNSHFQVAAMSDNNYGFAKNTQTHYLRGTLHKIEKETQTGHGDREIAAILEQAADQNRLAIKANAAGKKDESISWDLASKSLQAKASYQAKANQAEDEGKEILAAGYRDVVVTLGQAANQSKLSAENYAKGNIGNNAEGWYLEGVSLKAKADYQAKAIEAEEAGKAVLGVGYREAVMISHRAAQQHRQSVQACAARRWVEGSSWNDVGKSFQAMADYQSKASEAQEAEKEILAVGYREAVVISEQAADQFKQSAGAHAAGKQSEGFKWGWTGKALQAKADYHAKANEAQEARKEILAVGYKEAAIASQQAADLFKQAAEVTKGAETDHVKRSSIQMSWVDEGMFFQKKARLQVKTIEAQEAGQATLVTGYRGALALLQQAEDLFKQATLAFAEGKDYEYDRLHHETGILQHKADCEVKASEAEEEGDATRAAYYRKSAVTWPGID